MPIPDFNGKTFVAFSDISGFKEMMKNDARAVKALDHFYTTGFEVLRNNQDVHGAFISDCAILFVNKDATPEVQLKRLLHVVDQLNRQLLIFNIMLTTSIAYGQFSYHRRFEFKGIEKNPVYGNAYVAAFLDNESGQPRIQPGECRIIKQGLRDIRTGQEPRLRDHGKHCYFYWMVNDDNEIDLFNENYKDAYQQKYRGMLKAIQDAVKK